MRYSLVTAHGEGRTVFHVVDDADAAPMQPAIVATLATPEHNREEAEWLRGTLEEGGSGVSFRGRRILPSRVVLGFRSNRKGAASDHVVLVRKDGGKSGVEYVTGLVYTHAGETGDIREWDTGCYHDEENEARACFERRANGGYSCGK